jgi:hypothetical protein
LSSPGGLQESVLVPEEKVEGDCGVLRLRKG